MRKAPLNEFSQLCKPAAKNANKSSKLSWLLAVLPIHRQNVEKKQKIGSNVKRVQAFGFGFEVPSFWCSKVSQFPGSSRVPRHKIHQGSTTSGLQGPRGSMFSVLRLQGSKFRGLEAPQGLQVLSFQASKLTEFYNVTIWNTE